VIAEPLSPELALVDPELAERARRALPEPPVEVEPPAQPTPPAPPSPRPPRGIVRRLGVPVLLASVFLNVVLLREKLDPAPTARPAQPAIAVVAGAEAEVPRKAKLAPAAAKPAPRQRPKVARRTISWPAAERAVAYDVIVWRGHRRIADVWTEKPHLDVAVLRCGHQLAPGRYLWFVYPVRSRAAPRRYGRMVKWGALQVPAAGSCRS
jgi:hypothetical protein